MGLFSSMFERPTPEAEDLEKKEANKRQAEDNILMGPEGDHAPLALTNHMPRETSEDEAARLAEIARLEERRKELLSKKVIDNVKFQTMIEADQAKLPKEKRNRE